MSRRIREIDGLRALAILSVFVHHALNVPMTWMGVDLFFVLSGFLITGILLDAPKNSFKSYLGAFYERRVRRILPPFILLLVVFSLVYGVQWARHWYLYLGLMNYLFIDSTPHLESLLVLWSLAVEEQFYAVWPVVIFFVRPKWLPLVLTGLLLAAPMLRGLLTGWAGRQSFNANHWFIYASGPTRVDCLAAGALLTFAWRNHREKICRMGYVSLSVALCMIALMPFLDGSFSIFSNTVKGNVITYEVTLLCSVALVAWALSGKGTAVLTTLPALWLAKISYTFYLLHRGILLYMLAHIPTHSRTQQRLLILCAFAIAALAAEVSWRLLEKPILHGGRKKASLEATAALGA